MGEGFCPEPRRPQQQLTTGLVFGGQGSAEAARAAICDMGMS